MTNGQLNSALKLQSVLKRKWLTLHNLYTLGLKYQMASSYYAAISSPHG